MADSVKSVFEIPLDPVAEGLACGFQVEPMDHERIGMKPKKNISPAGPDERADGAGTPDLEMTDNVAAALGHAMGFGNHDRVPQGKRCFSKKPGCEEYSLPANAAHNNLLHSLTPHSSPKPPLHPSLLTPHSSLPHAGKRKGRRHNLNTGPDRSGWVVSCPAVAGPGIQTA